MVALVKFRSKPCHRRDAANLATLNFVKYCLNFSFKLVMKTHNTKRVVDKTI